MNLCVLALLTLTPSHPLSLTGDACPSSGYSKAFEDIFQPANIFSDDNRYGLSQGASKFNISSQEQEWLSEVTGKIMCPGKGGKKVYLGAASLVGRNDTLVTNAHVLYLNSGEKKADWGRCHFESFAHPGIERRLGAEPEDTVLGTQLPDDRPDRDYAILRLRNPLSGVEPIPIHPGAGAMKVGDSTLMVSSTQLRMKKDRKVQPNEPVVQVCAVGGVVRSRGEQGGGLQTNCSTTDGSSASVSFVRDASKRLVGIGIHAGGKNESPDGAPVDYKPDGNYGVTLTFEGPFLRDLQRSNKEQTSL